MDINNAQWLNYDVEPKPYTRVCMERGNDGSSSKKTELACVMGRTFS